MFSSSFFPELRIFFLGLFGPGGQRGGRKEKERSDFLLYFFLLEYNIKYKLNLQEPKQEQETTTTTTKIEGNKKKTSKGQEERA